MKSRSLTDFEAAISPEQQFFRKLLRDKRAFIGGVILIVYILAALSIEGYQIYCSHADITPIFMEEARNERFAAPSLNHWLGTDYVGRDVFWRAVAGSSTALKVGLIASLISAIVGLTLGSIGGYFGGKIDAVVVWLFTVFAAMPTLLFILAFALLFNKGFLSPEMAAFLESAGKILNADLGMLAIYLAIGLTGWVTICRVVRGETMKLRNANYIMAAQVSGVAPLKIIIRHIVPNLFHLIIIYFTLRFAYAIMTEVIVSYLGLGVQKAPSWGVMIADGQTRLWCGVWWEVAAGSGFMFLLVLALHLLG
ncbi:MAG: ABC transporter permease, partial [Lentisphaeria bacterium]|nr:ABC transporter permease [Lentisphaeria bacterium]